MPDSTTTIIGNATRDPELRYTAGGTAFCNFGVAVNRRWKNQQSDEWQEEVSFFNVVCWKDLAEHVSESVPKGARVVVTGRLQQRSWETDSGEKRTTVEVVADDVGASLRWATCEIHKSERSARSSTGAPARSAPAAAGYDDLLDAPDGGEPF